MPRARRSIVTLQLLVALAFACRMAHVQLPAQDLICPSQPPPYPGSSEVLECWEDSAGNKYDIKCTNESPSGNFVFEFKPGGGSGTTKIIGRCVFEDGQNQGFEINDENGVTLYTVWVCEDGGESDGEPWDTVVYLFDVLDCQLTRFCLSRDPGTGEPIENPSERHVTTPEDFHLAAAGGYDAMLGELTRGLYAETPANLRADFAAVLRLSARSEGSSRVLTFNTGSRRWRIRPGDTVLLFGVDGSSVVAVPPQFDKTDGAKGLVLTSLEERVLENGDVLAKLGPSYPGAVRYSISSAGSGALEYFAQLAAGGPWLPGGDFIGGGGVVPAAAFRRSDSNGDGRSDISDAIFTLNWLFLGAEEPRCMEAADANDSGEVNLSDSLFTFMWLFLSGEAPPYPGPLFCGSDLETSLANLGCASEASCR